MLEIWEIRPLATRSGRIPNMIAVAANTSNGAVIVHGASFTPAISDGRLPKKTRFIVQRVYPAVRAVETTAPIDMISLWRRSGSIADLTDP
jgi:hypothetical protein